MEQNFQNQQSDTNDRNNMKEDRYNQNSGEYHGNDYNNERNSDYERNNEFDSSGNNYQRQRTYNRNRNLKNSGWNWGSQNSYRENDKQNSDSRDYNRGQNNRDFDNWNNSGDWSNNENNYNERRNPNPYGQDFDRGMNRDYNRYGNKGEWGTDFNRRQDYGQFNQSQDYGRRNYSEDYDRNQKRGNDYDRNRNDNRNYGNNERGWWDRTKDEVSSWFGDDDAERRRERDERNEQMASHRGKGPKDYKRSEDRIREDVSDRLSDSHDVDASEISVRVEGTEVILSGEAKTKYEKRRAEDIAEQVSGVTNVQNHLRIWQENKGNYENKTIGVTQHTGSTAGQQNASSYGSGSGVGSTATSLPADNKTSSGIGSSLTENNKDPKTK